MNTASSTVCTESILEVRYTPNPQILDYRGSWTEAIGALMGVAEWRISENRLDVYDKENNLRAFVSFRNAGVVVQDSPTRNYFGDQAAKFMRYLMEQKPFGDPVCFTRFGVRSRFATPTEGSSFDTLLKSYMRNYLQPSEAVMDAISATVTDIVGPVNFGAPEGVINSMSGPMLREQLKGYFRSREDLPEVALYFDFDYHAQSEATMDSVQVSKRIKEWSGYTWDLHEKLLHLVLS